MTHLEEKLKKYFDAVETVKKQSSLPREEKLRLLLEPIVELYYGASNQGRKHQFACEQFIYLEEELDLSSLDKRSDAWYIRPNWKLGQFRHLDTREEIISVNYQKFLPSMQISKTPTTEYTDTSVYQLYKHWLPVLDKKRMKSKDLLDQILVCFTIKRAQNGDKKAGEKLMSLYRGKAESKETHTNVMKMLTTRQKKGCKSQHQEQPSFDETDGPVAQIPYDDEFRQQANVFMTLIIRGLSPKVMLDILRTGRISQTIPLPRGVADVFFNYYGEIVPGMVNKYISFQKSCLNVSRDPMDENKLMHLAQAMNDIVQYFHVNNINESRSDSIENLKHHPKKLKPAAVSKQAISLLRIAIQIQFVLPPFFESVLDPYTPINSDIALTGDNKAQAARILSACYRPRKMGPKNNLTTWLFGGKGKSYALGRLYQMLSNHYAKKPEDDCIVSFEQLSEDEYSQIYHRGITGVRDKVSHTADLEMLATKAGISEDDLGFLLDHYNDFTLNELMEKYNLTKDKVRYKIKTLLKKLQDTASK